MTQVTFGRAKARQTAAPVQRKFLTLADLREKGILFHSNHLRRMWQATPPQFPPPFYLSERRFAWDEKVVDDWIAAKMAAPPPPRKQAPASPAPAKPNRASSRRRERA